MFQSYTMTYHCIFDHDGKSAGCSAKIIFQSNNMAVIQYKSSLSEFDEPVIYAINEYHGVHWIANLKEKTSTFIADPADTASMQRNLLEFDGMDEYEAEELTEAIRLVYFSNIPYDLLEEDNIPRIEDTEFPF